MEKNKKFWELLEGNTDKPRVLLWVNIVNGLPVSGEDIGDEDAMRENRDF